MRLLRTLLLGPAVLLVAPIPAHASTALSPDEARLVELTNQARTEAGVSPLSVAEDLVGVSRQHATEMSTNGRVAHNQDLNNEATGWIALGENVGNGADVDAVQDGFMTWPHHHANVVDARWKDVGVGVVRSGDLVWVTVVFRQPVPRAAPQRPRRAATTTTASPPLVPVVSDCWHWWSGGPLDCG